MSAFNEISSKDYLYEGKHFYIVNDKYPVSPGHLLIISKYDKIDYSKGKKVNVTKSI